MMEREYIVTAKTKEDLESLYHDLETLGGCDCIPEREVECVHRRPISRNTHYYLTDEEAELIKTDPRVLDVALTPEERGAEITPAYTLTTTTWNKAATNSDAHRAWAMYRCVNGATVGSWGSDGTASQNATVLFTNTGKNVDVVVVDGCFDPAHPEFALNEAGTGGSRVNQFNWFSLNPTVTGGAARTYLYSNAVSYAYTVTNNGSSAYTFSGSATGDDPTLNVKQGDTLTFTVNATGHPFWIKTTNTTGTGDGVTTGTITNNGTQSGTVTWNTSGVTPGTYYYICQFHGSMVGTINVASGNGAGNYINGSTQQQRDNNHGCHVAGTFAGNRRGWAREANIYNINPYGSAPSTISSSLLIDYIRAWHNSKTVNTTTGRKNPTVTNHSYEINYDVAISSIEYVIYRGTQYNNPTAAQLTSFGLINDGTNVIKIPFLSTAAAVDIQDAITDGIIFIGAAGNSSFKIDIPGGQDYDNQIKQAGFSPDYYHRGAAPASLPNVICVGAIDATVVEQKATFSNCGPRIDVYAPGVNIVSSVHSNEAGVTDSRTNSIGAEVIKYQGTSMAAPNVAGVVACLAEQWPRMRQEEVRAYFGANSWGQTNLAKLSQVNDNTNTNRPLQGSPNRYLYYPMVRRVPNPSGTTYIGGATTSQISFPRSDNKFRPVLSTGNPDTTVYNSGMVYPRHPIWNRSLT